MKGDFNFWLEQRKDSTSQVRDTGMGWRNNLKKKLYQHQIVDVWKSQHINARDYTFHSPVHGMYSRLDFFVIEHRLLEVAVSTNIWNNDFFASYTYDITNEDQRGPNKVEVK